MNVEEIFLGAVEKGTPAERAAFLDGACGPDVALRAHVEALLGAHDDAGNLLDRPLFENTQDHQPPAQPSDTLDMTGAVIGPYKLLEPIGEGGFGVVYMAEQQRPIRRKVALKVVKPGMDSKQVVARFEAERQALALMDHPNIARVLDAGTTEGGLPYFVMELVRGVPITAFCDNNRLTTGERLHLFVTVCQAVQHAHTKGIIHRDLKPSNVLVTLHDGQPVVKVIDFGIAKALGQQLTERTLFTGFAQMVGTPLYMSPEQAEMSGLDIDTRSDVYSLGVLLYELLTGTTPLDRERLGKLSYDELRRVIREEEPPRPSTRISTLGQAATTLSVNRRSGPKQLSQLFRRELDWVVMKALEKDRNRRYESASAFAADVQRFLNDEPVLACPPSALYRARKFARRNKGAMVLASTILAALLLVVVGLALSTLLVWQAKQGVQQALERERTTVYFQRIALADRELATNNLSRAMELLEQCPEDLRGWEWHYLRRLARGKGQTVLKHQSAVLGAAVSPDGRWLASSCQDGTVRVWDVKTGREIIQPIPAHKAHARCVAFSPDGQRLASVCWGKPTEVIIWDWQNRRKLLSLGGYNKDINCVAFSPDGRWLVSGTETSEKEVGEVRIYDAVTGQHLRTFSGLPGNTSDLAFSPDGRRLASIGYKGAVVKVWEVSADVETWKPLPFSWRGQRRVGWGVAFSPDSRLLAAASGDFGEPGHTGVTIWDAQTGEELRTLGGHVDGVATLAFSPNGQRLVTGGLDQNIKVWDVQTGQEVLTLTGHLDMMRRVVFSPDGHQLVSASNDGTIRIWDGRPLGDSEPGQELRTLTGHKGGVNSVAYHPDGRLASAGTDGTIHVWDSRDGRVLSILRVDEGQVRCVAFSPRGRWLAAVSEDKLVHVWAIEPGRAAVAKKQAFTLPGHRDEAINVAFSRDGRHLASAGYEFVVRIWHVETRKHEQKLVDHNWPINGIAFSPDGRSLASAGEDGSVRLWDLRKGREIPGLRLRHDGRATCVAFRPDGQVLASGGWDRTVRLWEREGDGSTWKPLSPLTDPTGGVQSVAFSPKGDRLAWGATDGTVKVREPESGKAHTFRGHLSYVHSVAFSSDGRTLASGSQDGTVKIWKVPGK
jgi:WD40 repeat protein/serine/threonine protein kinase